MLRKSPPAPKSAGPGAHTEAFRQVWLARYGSLEQAADLARQHVSVAADDQRLMLRMLLLLQRLAPQSLSGAGHYRALADQMLALGDWPGHLMATSFALGLEAQGGSAEAALAAYERLSPEIDRMDDALEQHVAISSSLYIHQARGNLVAYMQQACRMHRLANEVDHGGMRLAAAANLGIAHHLVGDELQARTYLERALASNELGGWVRFSSVAILAEIYASAGELDQVVPLLQLWSFPERPAELDGPTLLYFHALGAEVHARLGHAAQTQAYLDHVQQVAATSHGRSVRCMLVMARALHRPVEAAATSGAKSLAEVLALAQEAVDGDWALPARFWWMAAELASAQGHWEQAYRLLERHRRLQLNKTHDIAAVRRVAAQFQVDASERAVEAAQRDRLTGLGNRERLIAVGDQWSARGLEPMVAMLNVRRFNAINEALGRDVGDAVLQAVADRLRQVCIRFEHALAGRIYADRFALVVAYGKADVPLLKAMATELFATPLEVVGQLVDIRAAWGVAQGAAHAAPMHRLMSQAEIALHEDRRSDAGWTVYGSHLVQADPRQLSLISDLRRAAQRDEFLLHLQPKFRLSDQSVTSFESLIRWNHPLRGFVPPAEFIPFAEQTGCIKGITEWVLRRAMRLSVELRAAGLVSSIAVNVSVHDVAMSGFREQLVSMLNDTGALAEDIRLELTEGAVMKDPATVVDQMREIHALGFEWSVDDFGTGQSSLAYLHMLPVSELKIDRSFVRGAANSSTMLTLLKAAIDLGRNLGLCTVGEGAETAEEWALLRDLGCDVAQGWHGARPMAEAALMPWLKQRKQQPLPLPQAQA